MAKKINSRDLFEKEDIFEGIRLSAQKTLEELNKVDQQFKQIAQSMRTALGSTQTNTTAGIQSFTKATEDANKAVENSIQIEKLKAQATQQALKAEQEREKVAQQKIRTQSAQAKEQERLNKIQERSTRTAQNEANAYKRLEKNTRDLKNESKRLGAEMLALERAGKQNTDAYRKLSAQYQTVTSSAQRGDAQLKKLDKTVGDNFRNVGNYASAMGKLNNILGAFGVAFGVQAVAQVFRTGAEAVVEFDQAISDLQAITGASGKDLEYYREQANLLGNEVEGGASAVVEAYKLIGSAKPELLANAEALNSVTKSAITLAQAAGISVPDAAKNLTDAMNQFGASAEDADKFINVLAAGSKFGAVEIPQVTDALLKFGAVAKTSGVSIEETGALIEALGERGLKGAEAGTALRNVMLKLSAPDALPRKAIKKLTELGINFDTLKDKSLSFTDRLRALTPILSDQAALVKTFGTENAVAATNLIQLTDRTDELRNKMTGTNTAYEQAEIRTATLGHAVMELKNAFLGVFTSINTGGGAMKSVVSSIQFLAENLGTIIKVVGNLLRMYVTFKAATMAQTLANGALSSSFVKVVQRVGVMKASLIGLQRGFGALKTAFMSNPFGILMTAAVEIYAHFDDIKALFGSVTKESQKLGKSQQDVASYSEKSAEFVAKEGTEFMKLTTELKSTNEGSEERSRLINEINKKYGTTLKNMKSERDFQEQINGEVKNYINFLKLKFKAQSLNEAMQNNFNKQLEIEAEINRLNMTIMAEGAAGGRQAEVVKAKKRQAELRMELEQTQGRFEGYAESLQKVEENLKGSNYNQSKYNDTLGEGNDELDENGKIIKNNGKATKQANTEFKKHNDYLSKQADLLEKLADIERKRKIAEIQKNIEAEIQLQSDKIKKTGEFDLTEFKRLIEEKNKLEIDRILNSADFEQEQNEIKYQREKQSRIDALEDEYKTLTKGAQGNQAALKKIDENYLIEKQKLANEEVLIFNDVIEENKAITKNATDEIDALNNASLDLTKKTNEDFLKEVEEFNTKKVEGTKEATDKELEDLKKAEEEKRAIVQTTSEFFQKQSDKRIEQYENEISAAEQQYEVLKELASAGNINASESLAEQQRIIDEANRKKAQEQQRQQRIKLAESVYSTYSQKVEAGSKNPLAETIRDTTLLQQFINSLPAFMDGTEDTGTNGKGIDGKGGFQAVLHPNERVIPKHLNEQIGAISNVDLARIAQEYNNGKIVEGGNQTRSALEFAVLVNELKDLKSVIQDKPETNIELGQITNSVMEIVQSRKQGNSVTYNRFKVRK